MASVASLSASIASSSLLPTAQTPASPNKPSPPFEFTRRKKWADLLVTELSEAIILVLSPQAKVLFCSHSVYELLGWKDDELIDHDLLEWVHAADKETFRNTFFQTQRDGHELLFYVRLRCKPDTFRPLHVQASSPPAILFELYGRPHILPNEQSARCVFAVAKPYPSRNTAMLNTFLELKIENARLQDRLCALRAQAQGTFISLPSTSSATNSTPAGAMQLAVDTRDPQAYYAALGAPPSTSADDDDEQKRKKRKVAAPEQYVCNTCGRTDSPEWRKGPRGPKTLCNACGLRWAKKVRKFEEGGGDASQQPLDDIVPP